MAQTALILGARGRFGRNAALAFEGAGWRVRRFDRAREHLRTVAIGADVIVNGWNPAYPDWPRLVPRLTEQVIDAARFSGATVILPGNVYVFGPQTPAPWSENSPHAASNELGRIRIEMEAAYRRSGVRTIILRAGDFLDTEASGNWFDRMLIPRLGRGVFSYPGNPEIPHAWAYLPDVARAAVALAARREELPAFADIPFPGYTQSGAEMCRALEAVTGRSLQLKRLSPLPRIWRGRSGRWRGGCWRCAISGRRRIGWTEPGSRACCHGSNRRRCTGRWPRLSPQGWSVRRSTQTRRWRLAVRAASWPGAPDTGQSTPASSMFQSAEGRT